MAPELSPELQKAVHQLHGSEALRIVYLQTKTTYVLVRAEIYDRLQHVLGDDDPRDAYPFVAAIMEADDEHDPLMAGYQTITRDPQQP